MSIARFVSLIVACAVVLLYGFWHHKVYESGYSAAQQECAKANMEREKEAAKVAETKQDKIVIAAAKHVQQAAESQRINQSNLAKVDQYAPTDFPPLPGSFRLFHDAAATGEEVSDPTGVNASSVSLRAVAVTVAENYASCNYDKQRLIVLQHIVRILNGESDGEEAKSSR